MFAGRTKCSRGAHLVQVNLSLELFENRIFVRGPSDFRLEFSVRKPNCSNCETFENRGLTVIASCTNHLQNLREYMTRRFKDIIEISLPCSTINMAHFDVLSEEDIDPIIPGELLELKENKALMANIKKNGLIGWLNVGSFYLLLFEKVVSFLLGFPTTWLVEAGFSAVNDLGY